MGRAYRPSGEGPYRAGRYGRGMRRLFATYRVLAFIVGVLLLVGTVSFICKYGFAEGSSVQQFGESLGPIWLIHGWIYIVYVVVAFLLSEKAGWKRTELLVLFAAGLVPVLIFFVEHRVSRRIRAELAAPPPPQ